MPTPKERVAKALRQFCADRGFDTVKAAAVALGYSPSTFRNWHTGRKFPNTENMIALWRAGVPIPVDLLPDEQSMFEDVDGEGGHSSGEAREDYGQGVGQKRAGDVGGGDRAQADLAAGGRTMSLTEDPLTSEEAGDLLTLVDVVRDPLHGDIRLTALERCLIDTPEFQRLRRIHQLGPTFLVYPGALHNRFLHSLGTLQVCTEMIDACNANADTYKRLAASNHPVPLHLSPYTVLLARVCALLHDLAHVPFGHSLEKEGRVFDRDEWDDPERVTFLFGEGREGGGRIGEHVQEFFKSRDLPIDSATCLVQEVRDVLTAGSDELTDLRYPFVHDLVGNTICADLIDYVQRDSYFAGLRERFGDRFLRYISVMTLQVDEDSDGRRMRPVSKEFNHAPATQKNGSSIRAARLVLHPYRYNERRSLVKKHDVIAEAIDLVRRRLAVAEKIYFHRTKTVATSMINAAAYSAGIDAMDLWDLSDWEVLKLLEGCGDSRANVLANKVMQRRLFKPIYRTSYHQADASDASKALWHPERGAYSRFREPEKRAGLVEQLERLIGIAKSGDPKDAVGSVAVYCPERDMNVKYFEMLVLDEPGADIQRLQNSDHPPTQQEIDSVINTHRHLWELVVFVDPEIVKIDERDAFTRKLAGVIQQEVGPKNELEAFRNVEARDLSRVLDEKLVESDLKALNLYEEVSVPDFKQLCETAEHGGYDTLEPAERRNRIAKQARQMGYTRDE